MMKAIVSLETSDLTRVTLRHIPEDGILVSRGVAYKDFVQIDNWTYFPYLKSQQITVTEIIFFNLL
jgi:hypothetical protein